MFSSFAYVCLDIFHSLAIYFRLSQKAIIMQTNSEVKERALKLLEEEYKLKIEYQRKELCHQNLRHKLEIEALKKNLEKQDLEIQLLKSKMS